MKRLLEGFTFESILYLADKNIYRGVELVNSSPPVFFMNKILYDYALKFVGVPYLYGGVCPFVGLDCSALVRILIHSQGAAYNNAYTAQSLWQWFSDPANHSSVSADLGALVFYGGSRSSIDHVAMALSPNIQIEAAGGSSSVLTREQAIAANAWVKITPIRQTGQQGIFMPHYPFCVP